MAVYKRSYKGYSGALTPTWSRFLILPRYSYTRLFQSKFLIFFLMSCFFFPIGCAAFIYLSHNLSFLRSFRIQAGNLLDIDSKFFLVYCNIQGAMAYLLTAFVGPSLATCSISTRNSSWSIAISREPWLTYSRRSSAPVWSRPIWPTTRFRCISADRFRAPNTSSEK